MLPVLLDVGGVDTQHIFLGAETVDQNIVYDAAAAVGHGRILHLAVVKLRYVVRGDVLQQGRSLVSLDPYLAHVAYVEHAGLLAHGHVLVIYARELDGHVVTRKLGHLGAVCDVILGESCGFHLL